MTANRFARTLAFKLRKLVRGLVLVWHEVRRDGGSGFWRFVRHHKTLLQRDRHLRRLERQAQLETLTLDLVYAAFVAYPCAEEDRVVAEWFMQGHNALVSLSESLASEHVVDTGLLRKAIRETGYIVEAEQFFHRWPLQTVQAEVKMLYQALVKQMEQLASERAKERELEQKRAVVEEKRIELETIKEKKAAILAKQALVEAEHEKLEAERALRKAKAEEHREAQKRIAMEQELEAQRAQTAQQAELESSLSRIAEEWESRMKKE